MRTEDALIIQECLNGESEAFGILVDKYKAGIYAYVYAKLGNLHDSEDATQEVFLSAYRSLKTLRRWESFSFWLYRIARNVCRNRIRTQSKRPDREFAEDQDAAILSAFSMNSHRESQVDESLQESLSVLSEGYREVLMLHYFGGMKSADIARSIGISPTAVRKRLSRARIQLREEMVATMDTAFEGQRLPVTFTFRIVEAIKHIKVNPMPRMAGVPWGLSLAVGIIIAVLSLNPHLRLNPARFPASPPLPVEAKPLETGEIPVDMLTGSQMLAISGKQEDIARAALFAPTKAAAHEGQIVFARKDGGVESVWVMDADGENERKLADGPGPSWSSHPSWSPDGSHIAFAGAGVDIYVMNANGTGKKRVIESGLSGDQQPTWSPDGKQIAFLRVFLEDENDDGILEEDKGWAIHVVNVDGTNLRSLGEKPPPHEGGFGPAWSPDGSKIAYEYWGAGRSAVWVMDADGQNRRMVYWWGGNFGGPDWSPDGDKIVFCSDQDSWNNWNSNDIFVINADGKGLKRLTEPGPAWHNSPIWSPDGTKIAFSSDQDGDWHLYVMNADGSNVQQLNVPVGDRHCSLDWAGLSYGVEPADKLPTTWDEVKQR